MRSLCSNGLNSAIDLRCISDAPNVIRQRISLPTPRKCLHVVFTAVPMLIMSGEPKICTMCLSRPQKIQAITRASMQLKKNMSRETWDKLIKSVSPPSQPIASPIVISLLVIFTVLAAYFFFFVAVPAHPPRKSGALFILLICIAVTLAWEWSAKKRTPAYETAFQKYLRRMICTKCWQISS